MLVNLIKQQLRGKVHQDCRQNWLCRSMWCAAVTAFLNRETGRWVRGDTRSVSRGYAEAEKEHSRALELTKLLPENRQKMEHLKLLMVPENL